MGELILALKVMFYCLPVFILLDKGRVIYALLGYLFLGLPILFTLNGILSAKDDGLSYLMLQIVAWLSVGFLALRLPKIAVS